MILKEKLWNVYICIDLKKRKNKVIFKMFIKKHYKYIFLREKQFWRISALENMAKIAYKNLWALL